MPAAGEWHNLNGDMAHGGGLDERFICARITAWLPTGRRSAPSSMTDHNLRRLRAREQFLALEPQAHPPLDLLRPAAAL